MALHKGTEKKSKEYNPKGASRKGLDEPIENRSI
jgi:hypothetical protein